MLNQFPLGVGVELGLQSCMEVRRETHALERNPGQAC